MSKIVVKIYYDGKDGFYVERISESKELLPEYFVDFKTRHRELLSEAYPELREDIFGARAGDSVIYDVIEPKIAQYNEDVLRSKSVKLYKAVGKELKRLSAGELPDGCDEREYKGEPYPEDILAYIESLKKELVQKAYAVFACAECGEKQVQLVRKNRVVCQACKVSLSVEIARYRFSDGTKEENMARAIEHLLRFKAESGERQAEEDQSDGCLPFYFGGSAYRVSFTDCKALLGQLYRAFAVEEVFVEGGAGITFTTAYKQYLKGLKEYGDYGELYKQIKTVENRVNSQEYALLPVEKAFYWYMRTYCAQGEKELVWRLNGRVVVFADARQFVQDLLAANEENRRALIELYESVAGLPIDDGFFGDCDGSLVKLSHLIYRQTGRFVYVTREKWIDFGSSFIDSLSDYDKRIADRNAFIESIRMDCPAFWDEIKGELDDFADYYYDSCDGTYYDRLCFYRYAIQGKRTFVYKSLRLSDSLDGFQYVKSIARDTYLSKSEDALREYRELSELLSNELLWGDPTKLSKLREAQTTTVVGKQSETLTFDGLRAQIVAEPSEPSLKLYLTCSELSARSVKRLRFWYGGELATAVAHLKRIAAKGDGQTLEGELKRFYADTDVRAVLKTIFDYTKKGGFAKFEEEHEKAFLALVGGVKKLNEDAEALRKKLAADEARGVRRK